MVRFWALLMALTSTLAQAAAPNLESVARLTRDMDAEARRSGRSLSLESVLSRLGETYPELRANYVLMHDSRSRQGASYEFPRVIAHSADARFALTFNGDPSASGYHELEMYEFSADAPQPGARPGYRGESFKFRRIVFEPSALSPSVMPVNEARCQSCHESRIRPNWEAYNRWEGAYPENDHHLQGTKYRFGYQSEIHDGFDRFYTRQAAQGRYTFLRGLDEQFVVGRGGNRRVAPSQFTQVVGYLNYRRIAHLMLQSPGFDRYKYAALGALYDCAEFESFFPTDHASAKPLGWYIDDTEAVFAKDANYEFLRGDGAQWGKLRYVLEGRGIRMSDWSMSFRRSPYTFVTPGGMPEGFLSSILMEYDKSLEPFRVMSIVGDDSYVSTTSFVQPWTGSMTKQTAQACRELRDASRKALGVD